MSLKEAKYLVSQIKEKWQIVHKLPGIFAYTLNVRHGRYIPEERWNFYTEYNPERTRLRRVPQSIYSLEPVFDEEKFNFKKIKAEECLMIVPFGGEKVSMIINASPLTLYHTLICPAVDKGYPQRITALSLEFCARLLLNLQDKSYRIGYNSPGALASVNHLHLHLIHVEKKLYVDCVTMELLPSKNEPNDFIYKLSREMPTEAVCFVIFKEDTEAIISVKLKRLHQFIEWLIQKNIPHNLFLTLNAEDNLCIFIYAREQYCIVKDTNSYNIGFCELAGYVPVGDEELYDILTEELLITKIREATGNVYERIYNYLMNDVT